MIELKGLTKVFRQNGQEIVALSDVNLHVPRGQIFGILGQSGAGKSTLIRCVNLLERPTAGEVWVDGREITRLSPGELRAARREMGMIFQQFNLFDSRTVFGNVAYPLEVAGWPRARIRERVEELLALVGLADKAGAYPNQLSGGQKQRVGIARALAPGPKLLLSDEATSALDPDTTRSVLALLREINRRLGLTILLITHQMEVVKQVCDSVAILEEGKVVEQGGVLELIGRPGSRLRELFYESTEEAAHRIHPDGVRVLLFFVGASADRPLISETVRRFRVDANILQGAVERIAGATVGRLLVEFTGLPEDIQDALRFLEEQGASPEVIPNG
ncbi:methionine ABC transporter ATP-binding protein [Symbiobacterium thermophilum]|uniref:Methionine import ATP-binding protein MetN n=2 Tax=Symbiobacterium thermophilum TaxID=2734 RepID=METN_SYMTH|nr:methionine ABC transporter ATP-binding protein [Symbiobacterium thermophilum]Q67SV5.1 RecName: Full=Methionine import ATP-binding protein MetN [Symbiobacterium thermophilum IAM 14863]MBY6275193.1 methionine import ATP-binding protein MetN [Symbiobacterium thermophilum]BAD39238.1 ABC transporter ATP-binding protein [Symbiobacterium thermophilum IAM 14863]